MEATAEQHAKAKAECMALRRSKQPVSVQIRQLSTKLQNENSKMERILKASQAKKEELDRLQEEVKSHEEKLASQRRTITDLEGQLRALGNWVAKPPDADSVREAGGQVNLDVLDKLLQAAGVTGELVATVKTNPLVEQLVQPRRSRDEAQPEEPVAKRPRAEDGVNEPPDFESP